jgi:hypothetical protein
MPASCGSSRAHYPGHYHGFAQVSFILKGAFTIDGRLCPPGTMLYHPDPHFEGVFRDRRRDPDRAVSRPVDRRAADLCRAVQHGKAEGG